MDSTWAWREFPVLEAVISQFDKVPETRAWPDATDIAARTGLELADVCAALLALDGWGIALVRPLTVADWHVTAVAPEARRVVGQWPTGEALVEQLIAGIGEAAERETDGDRRGQLRAVALGLASGARQIAINVASAYLDRAAPR